MSAMLPKADIFERHVKSLLLTQSGHSSDYAIPWFGAKFIMQSVWRPSLRAF